MSRHILEDIFYFLTVVSIFCGGVFWLSSMDVQSTANAEAIKQITVKVDETSKDFTEIRVRLAHIEDALK